MGGEDRRERMQNTQMLTSRNTMHVLPMFAFDTGTPTHKYICTNEIITVAQQAGMNCRKKRKESATDRRVAGRRFSEGAPTSSRSLSRNSVRATHCGGTHCISALWEVMTPYTKRAGPPKEESGKGRKVTAKREKARGSRGKGGEDKGSRQMGHSCFPPFPHRSSLLLSRSYLPPAQTPRLRKRGG